MSPDPLDNLVWHALKSEQKLLSEESSNGCAVRFRPDVSPFCGMRDESEESWAGLSELTGSEGVALLMGPKLSAIPPDWELLLAEVATQWLPRNLPLIDPHTSTNTTTAEFFPLQDEDVPEMLALAEMTEPGPFMRRTIDTGCYVGLRREGELIAMAGERMRSGDWIEVSAVCVHPEAQREGLGARLTLAVAESIQIQGKRPMLHVREGNEAAIALYNRIGFEFRQDRYVYAIRPVRNVADSTTD